MVLPLPASSCSFEDLCLMARTQCSGLHLKPMAQLVGHSPTALDTAWPCHAMTASDDMDQDPDSYFTPLDS